MPKKVYLLTIMPMIGIRNTISTKRLKMKNRLPIILSACFLRLLLRWIKSNAHLRYVRRSNVQMWRQCACDFDQSRQCRYEVISDSMIREETGYVRKFDRLVLSTTPCVRLCTLHLCWKYVEQTQSTREHSNVDSGDYACKNEVRS